MQLKGARFDCLTSIPVGWIINVNNSSSGDTELLGNIDVGAAAEDPQFIERVIRVKITAPSIDDVGVSIELELSDYRDADKSIIVKFQKRDVLFFIKQNPGEKNNGKSVKGRKR